MNVFRTCIFTGVALSCIPWPAIAHDCAHYRHHSRDCRDCAAPYTPSRRSAPAAAATEALEGRIVEVMYLPGSTPGAGIVELRLESETGVATVRLAPSGYLKRNRLAVREGDRVSVKGYRVTGMDGELLVATEIRKGETAVSLRDGRGRPVW